MFQDPTLDIELTGRENLDFHGRLYGLSKTVREERIKEILEVVQLTERASDYVKTYSGGMKRRLEIGRGLLHYPKVLFLDEPTLGLDPQTRRAIWEYIQKLNQEQNVTIILTTHYTDEADHLCNRIQIIDFGKIVANDTPENLKARLEGDIIGLELREPADSMKLIPLLQRIDWIKNVIPVSGVANQVEMSQMMQMMRGVIGGGGMGSLGNMGGGGPPPMRGVGHSSMLEDPEKKKKIMKGLVNHSAMMQNARQLNMLVDDASHRVPELVKIVDRAGIEIDSVQMHKPTLDDVFLSVTGRSIRDESGSMIQMFRRFRTMRHARGGRTPH